MNLHKKSQKENPWDISRSVYKFNTTSVSHFVAATGGESQKEKMSPEEIRKALKCLRDDIPAFERYRLEALENFKARILENSHDFKGSDRSEAQTVVNTVFQYAYGKLEELFKKDLNRNWPIKIYKDWMNAVCAAMADRIKESCGASSPFAAFLQTDKSDIDNIFQRLGTSWEYVGTFREYFARTAPQVFKEWERQHPQQKQNE